MWVFCAIVIQSRIIMGGVCIEFSVCFCVIDGLDWGTRVALCLVVHVGFCAIVTQSRIIIRVF